MFYHPYLFLCHKIFCPTQAECNLHFYRFQFIRVTSKWRVPMSQSERSLKWTVFSQSGRSSEPKWTLLGRVRTREFNIEIDSFGDNLRVYQRNKPKLVEYHRNRVRPKNIQTCYIFCYCHSVHLHIESLGNRSSIDTFKGISERSCTDFWTGCEPIAVSFLAGAFLAFFDLHMQYDVLCLPWDIKLIHRQL